MLYILIGVLGQLTLVLLYKKLKNPRIFTAFLVLTILIALFGYLNRSRESLEMVNGNAAEFTLLPLLFLIYYWIFRQLFLLVFKNEPLMRGQTVSWDIGEYRKSHLGDAFFTAATLLLPILTAHLII